MVMVSRTQEQIYSRRAVASENLLIAILAVTAGLAFTDRIGMVFVFSRIQEEFGLNHSDLGLLMAPTAVTWAIASIGLTYLSDWLGGRPKQIIVACVILFSLATGAMGLARNFTDMMWLRAIIGLAAGPVIPLVQSVVARSSSPHRIGRNMGIIIGGVTICSAAIAPALMNGLEAVAGWRVTFFAVGLPGVALGGILYILLGSDERDESGETRPMTIRMVSELFSYRNFLVALGGAALAMGNNIAFSSFLPIFLEHQVRLAPVELTTLLVVKGLAATAGTVLAPTLSDRFSRRGCLIVATAFLTLVPVALIFSAQNHLFLIPAIFAMLMSSGTIALMTFIIPGASVPLRLRTTAFGMLVAFGEITGAFLAPPLAGVLADRFGLPAAMWCASALALGAMIAATLYREPPRTDQPAH
ncbi:major facilitator superfamily MFS_1 [Sphingobium chlorophenolicum L-1]|uniref:Major facilitator superfamily MFS_1 n=2 Tax=Sphingobium chlorophenolicum TaxID=46429 RepID=F6F2C4_SPHCR|nr:major facilitator superfamily MFS_1 [Sphingobium chlorophenolicum L-1]